MIDEQKLAEWERLANEATEGPWVYGENNCDVYDVYSEHDPEDVDAVCSDMLFPNSKNDAAFIAMSREAVPALIAEVRGLQKTLHAVSDTSNKLLEDNNQLEKEADWLSEKCAMLDDGISGLNATEYRELARRSAR